MAFTDTWDATFETKPDDNNYGYEIDDYIRRMQTGFRERFEIDHYMDIAGTDADHGMHKKITFRSQEAKPAAVANRGFLYIKDVAAKAELHWEDEDGDEIAMTAGGKINAEVLSTISKTTQAALDIMGVIYPIGSIYISTLITNPATLLGFGTWTAFGAGRVIVGVGTSDAVYAAGATGGESTHTLSAAESGLPAHTHPITTTDSGGGPKNTVLGGVSNNNVDLTSGANAAAAASSAHNNMPPYVVAYMWQRTA